MDFNINESVKVKLNDFGKALLKNERAALRERFPKLDPDPLVNMRTDAEGYTSFQLWDLMKRFGSHIGLGLPLPFDAVIKIGD